jgi:WD40 repeat protein
MRLASDAEKGMPDAFEFSCRASTIGDRMRQCFAGGGLSNNLVHQGMKPRSVFVSYTSKDRQAAEQIEETLREGGLDPWRDRSRLETDWPREIALALANCDALALLWTDNTPSSRWVKHEWLTARALEKPIVLCRFANCPDLPAPLAHLNGVDFCDVEQGCFELLKHIGQISNWRAHYDYTIIPPKAYLPFNPNPDFAGRDHELLELYLDLIGNLKKIGICQVGAVGIGGVGKTQLAIEYAFRFSYAFEHVFWVQAAESNRWADQLLDLAQAYLDITVSDEPGGRRVALLKLQSELKKDPNNLVIFDNVKEPLLLNSEVPLESSGLTALTIGSNILFTARRVVNLPGVKLKRVDVLEPASALRFLVRHRTPTSGQEWESASDICSAIGYLPLALVLISAFLAKRTNVSFGEYYDDLRLNRLDTIDHGGISDEQLATRHLAGVEKTFTTQWRANDNVESRLLLQLASLLEESAIIPKARLSLLAGLSFARHIVQDSASTAFEVALDLHLADDLEAGKSIRLHPLLRDAIQRTIEDPGKLRTQAAECLRNAYADPTRLKQEYIRRTPREMTADMRIALRWGEQSGDTFEHLRQLAQALDNEADYLDRQPGRSALTFLQQIHYRSATMGASDLATLFSRSLADEGAPFLLKLGGFGSNSAGERLRLCGHTNAVMGGRFLFGAQRALTTAWGTDLSLWDLNDGGVLRRTTGHASVANCLAVDESGRTAITGSDDKMVAVWDVESGIVLEYLRGHTDYVQDSCLSRDGLVALTAQRGGRLIAWDVPSRTMLARPPQQATFGFKGSIALSPDGLMALAPCLPEPFDGHWICWNVKTGKTVLNFHVGQAIWGSCFSDHTNVVFLTASNAVLAFDLPSNKIVQVYEGPAEILGVVSSKNGLIAAGSSRGEIAMWNTASGKLIGAHRGHSLEVKDIQLDPYARLALTTSEDGSAILWDVEASGFINLPKHANWVTMVDFSADGSTIVSGDEERLITWDSVSFEPIREVRIAMEDVRANWGITRDRKQIIAKFPDETYRLCDVAAGISGAVYSPRGYERLIAANVSSDGSYVLISDNDYQIGLFDCLGKHIRSERLSKMVHAISISADNNFALLGADYGNLLLLDLNTWTIAGETAENEESIMALSMDFASGVAAIARRRGEIEVRALPSLELVARLGTDAPALSIAVKGTKIAVGDNRGAMHFLQLHL